MTKVNCGFRSIAITKIGAWRSPKSDDADQQIRPMAIIEIGNGDHLMN